ncbi:molybdopterin dinucleotide-binding protein [Metallosphaera hakonensis JCM 8857 = DSM 7519]|nr:molybdopterin dinucleotide-binding protein [Metallosphaera hakonensis JCM 8857 = DSM 7519]
MSSSSSSTSSPVPNRRIPLPPPDAEIYHATCRFCNVGCGYDIFVFPVYKEGGPAKGQNAIVYNLNDQVFNRDLTNFQADYTSPVIPLGANYGTPWIGEGMVTRTVKYNTQTGAWEPVYILEVPSSECPVNEGTYSTRGGRNAQRNWSPFSDVASGYAIYQSRIQTPMLRWNNSFQPISWSYAIQVAATVSKYYLDNENFNYPDPVGPAAIQVMAIRSDHGGGQGGGVFSNMAPGLFLHMGLATPFVRFHYQVAFSLTEDALMEATNGNGTDTASMLDISIADTLVLWGINEYSTSTVNFIQHMFDNISGATASRKAQWFDQGEPTPPGNIIVVEARPNETVRAAAAKLGITVEQAQSGITSQSGNNGGGYMLYVQVNPGTDAELINAVAAYIYYTYPDVVNHFISLYQSASANGFSFNSQNYQYYTDYLQSKTLSQWLSEAESITGVPQNIIMQMGDLIAKPKTANGNTYYKRTLIEFEKGIIWSGNYTPIYALADLAIISGALSGRPGCGLSTGFGHQRGAAFPLPPPPPWSSNLSQGRQLWIQMSSYVPQQLQAQGMQVNATNIVNFIKNFYSQYTNTLVPQIYQYNPIIDYLIYSGYGKVLWIFTAVPYKQTMSGAKLGLTIDNRARLLQECVENSAGMGVPSSTTTTPTSSYNTSAVSQTLPSVPTPQDYANAVISCLGSTNGALFVVGHDIILNQNRAFENAAHLLMPATSNHGETYEIRWNGHDRRLRLDDAYHSPLGASMPDIWTYAMIAYVIYQMYQSEGNGNSPQAQRINTAFSYLWQTLSKYMMQNSQPLSIAPSYSENYYDYDWFSIYNDLWTYYVANGPVNFSSSVWPYGYFVPHAFPPGWSQITLEDLKMARTIGVQLPILGKTTNADGSFTLWGLVNYAEPVIHGKFRVEGVTVNPNQSVTVGNTSIPLITRQVQYITLDDVPSMFGYSADTLVKAVINGFNPFPVPYVGIFGYASQLQSKYKYWANNGRWNIIFQSGWTDFQVPEIVQRVPMPIIEISAQDAQAEGINNGDIIQVYNDYGSLDGIAWISNTVTPGQLFIAMAFEVKPGANQVTTPTVDPTTDNQMVKWSWVNIKKIGTLPQEMLEQITLAPVEFNVNSGSSSSS